MGKKLIASLIFVFAVSFQTLLPAQSAEQDRKEHDRKIQEHIWKTNTQIMTGKAPTLPNEAPKTMEFPQSTNPPVFRGPNGETGKEWKKAQAETKARLEEIRAPHSDDLAKYNTFLKAKNTGLFKLFPSLNCVSKGVVRVDGDCANAVNDSFSYSFQKRQYAGFHDLRLADERFWFDGFLSQAIVTEIGDIPLENVSLTNDYAKYLLDFKPQQKSVEAKQQFWEIAKKLNQNGFNYGKIVKANLNTTYLARIINYRVEIGHYDFRLRNIERSFAAVAWDRNRFDSVVAFRVVRIDDDKSITILWKELNENKSPKLKFAKDEKWTDLKTN